MDDSEECRGKYELVPISGNDTNKIADVLVGMHSATKIVLVTKLLRKKNTQGRP